MSGSHGKPLYSCAFMPIYLINRNGYNRAQAEQGFSTHRRIVNKLLSIRKPNNY